MRRLLHALFAALGLTAQDREQPAAPAPSPAPAPFVPGQVWSYRARPGEEGSRLTVCRVDPAAPGADGDPVVHVALRGLAFDNPQAPDGLGREIGHLPIAASALRASVLRLEETAARLPDFQEGHAIWKEGHDAGRAGHFTTPVAEVVDFVVGALASRE